MLDSNLFTHRNTYAILREATSETYGPRVYLLSYKLSIYFYFHLYFSNPYHKIPKICLSYHFISNRSHFRKWPWRDWQPLYCIGCEFLFVYVGVWDFWGASYWIVTLVLKNWGKYLRYYCCITLSSSRKTNVSSRRSKKDFWRRCRGGLRSSQGILSTHHKLISLALHYLPFASRFPLPHFTIAVLFALSFPISSIFRLSYVWSPPCLKLGRLSSIWTIMITW